MERHWKTHEIGREDGNKRGRFGLKGKLLIQIILPTLLLLSILGLYLMFQNDSIILTMKGDQVTRQTNTAAEKVEAYFEDYYFAVDLLGDTTYIKDLIKQAEREGEDFRFRNSENANLVLNLMQEVKGHLPVNTQNVWIAAVGNGEIMEDNRETTVMGQEMLQRPWYKMLVEKGDAIVTGAYEDATTGELVVSVVVPVLDGQKLIGAAGVDIVLDGLAEDLSQIHIGKSGYVVVYDSSNNIVYHPDPSAVLLNMADTTYSANMKDAIMNNQTMAAMDYQRKGENFLGSTVYIESFGWQVLGCMPDKEFHQEAYRLNTITIGGFVGCLLMLFVLCILIANGITRPIEKLNDVSKKLADGNLDVEIESKSRDEVGELADSISHIVDRLKTYILYINEVAEVLDHMGDGNLIFQLNQEYVGEFQRLKAAMLQIQRVLSHSLFELVDTAERVECSTTQIANGSQSLAQGASEQASTVEELNASVNELAEDAGREAQVAINASSEVTAMGSQLDESNQQMQGMLQAMNNITTQSAEIEKIVKTIQDIAFQTNILALNAAVEAARAGEAGKGFSVVADEVRNLAGKCGEAAQNITELIQASIQAVREGSQMADVTAASLSEVANKASHVVEVINHISDKYQDQTTNLNEIASGIEQISGVVQSTAATAEENAASSQELAAQVNVIRDLTQRFQLDEKFR